MNTHKIGSIGFIGLYCLHRLHWFASVRLGGLGTKLSQTISRLGGLGTKHSDKELIVSFVCFSFAPGHIDKMPCQRLLQEPE